MWLSDLDMQSMCEVGETGHAAGGRGAAVLGGRALCGVAKGGHTLLPQAAICLPRCSTVDLEPCQASGGSPGPRLHGLEMPDLCPPGK